MLVGNCASDASDDTNSQMKISSFNEPRRLGDTSIMVSPIAWGMWRLAKTETASVRALIEAAFEAGITFFDTAAVYGAI